MGFGGVGIAAAGTASGVSAAGVATTGATVGGLTGNAVKDFLWLPSRGMQGRLINSKKSLFTDKKTWQIRWEVPELPADEFKTSWHSPDEFDVLVQVRSEEEQPKQLLG